MGVIQSISHQMLYYFEDADSIYNERQMFSPVAV